MGNSDRYYLGYGFCVTEEGEVVEFNDIRLAKQFIKDYMESKNRLQLESNNVVAEQ